MVNRSKSKGSSFERQVADYLRDHLSEFIDRRVLTGGADKGDIANLRVRGRRVVAECKNVARMSLAEWVDQAREEATNDGAALGVVVHKRRARGQPCDQYVSMSLGDFVSLLRIAEEMETT